MYAFKLTDRQDRRTDFSTDGRMDERKEIIQIERVTYNLTQKSVRIQVNGQVEKETHRQTISELVDGQKDRNIHKTV